MAACSIQLTRSHRERGASGDDHKSREAKIPLIPLFPRVIKPVFLVRKRDKTIPRKELKILHKENKELKEISLRGVTSYVVLDSRIM